MLELYPFQTEAVERCLESKNLQVVYDTGTGKSLVGMNLTQTLFDLGEIDKAIIVCERNKLVEWEEDFTEQTTLEARKHHGPSRFKKVEKLGTPDVLVIGYETARMDLCTFETPRKLRDGRLGGLYYGQRVLVIYDEMSRLRNRSSKMYKAQDFFLKQLRREAEIRVVGLTATPIERDWEDSFNQLRLLDPERMPLVKDFEKNFVKFRDMYNRPRYAHSRMPEFVAMTKDLIIRKRKTDPDIMEQFPKVVEEVAHIEMTPQHKRFYELCEELAWTDDGEQVPGADMILRQVAGHPAALIHSARRGGSELAQMVVEELGDDFLEAIPCAKEQALLEHLSTIKDQGDKAVVFTFFGQSILPVLDSRLSRSGHKVFVYHGGQTVEESSESLKKFKAHDGPAVLLSSDSGAKGINIPEATYVIEYESALTYANRTQRINRIHRLSSDTPSVHCLTYVMTGTVEARLAQNMLGRNEMHDELLGEETAEGEHLLVADRKKMFRRQIG